VSLRTQEKITVISVRR